MFIYNSFTRSIIVIIFFILINNSLLAQDINCFDCHSDDGLSYIRSGKDVSLFVNEAKFSSSAHGSLECTDCHTDFDGEEIPHKDGTNIYKVDCADCHENISKQEKNDIHHRLGPKVGKNKPSCILCHNYHYVKSPNQVGNKSQFYCSSCHKEPRVAKGFHNTEFVSNDKCADCHDIEEQQTELVSSTHAKLACADCHAYAASNIETHSEDIDLAKQTNCRTCHTDVAIEHSESVHGLALSAGIKEAANCWSCHGSHNILPAKNEASKVHSTNLAATCGGCHDDPKFAEKFEMSVSLPGKMYSNSVHGKLVISGEANAANCTTCHGIHDIQTRVKAESKINPINIPETCRECHSKEVEEYENSIHWRRAQRGISEAPLCNDCHSEHSISVINNSHKKENELTIQENTCIKCHKETSLAQKFGKVGGQVEQYLNSYHGLAATRGDEDAALCVDCHGIHSILPKNYVGSKVNPNNVTETCRTCHIEATETFSKSYSHQSESEDAKKIEDFVSTLYFWLIISVIGGMIIHNLIIFFYEMRKKRRREKNVITLPRFTKNEVVQHFLLLTSFILLAITGFALKYPNSFWAEGLLNFGMTETVRQYTHRVSAVVMIVLSVYHLGYLLFTARGRDVLKEMLPNFDDIKGIVDNLSYYLRISKKHPHFGQYDYAEKAEYWALIWGTFVMGVTGIILWFPTIVGDWAPVWLIKVSETVHFLEAILATLAIIVWHWFFVIFHPKEYPMSFAWMDGQMPLEQYRHHHEKHFRRIILEWYKYNSNNKNKLSNYTKLFVSTLEKHGFNIDDVLQVEMNKDPELRMWYESEIEKIESINT